jgi:hypothetical protein
MHSSDSQAEGDISTLPAWGHFYFALTSPDIPGTRMAGHGVLYYNQQANPARPAVLSRKKRG